MKKCTYCGQQYPDEATECAIDSKPLESLSPDGVRQTISTRDAESFIHSITAIGKVASGNPTGIAHLPAINGTETISGVCHVWKCPRCNNLRDFRLVEGEVNVAVLGMKVANLGKLVDLRCDQCRFELKVDPAEKHLVAKAAEATQRLKEGRTTAADYVTEITNLPAVFVKHLLALTQNWNCPTCGEENPINFDTCWNCSSKVSGAADVSPDAKPFPGVPKGGNPWE